MSLEFSFYLGPFLAIPKDIDLNDLEQFEHLVCEGRGELRHEDDYTILVLNRQPDAILRCMNIGSDFGEYQTITANDIVNELSAFRAFAVDAIDWLHSRRIPFEIRWGIVANLG